MYRNIREKVQIHINVFNTQNQAENVVRWSKKATKHLLSVFLYYCVIHALLPVLLSSLCIIVFFVILFIIEACILVDYTPPASASKQIESVVNRWTIQIKLTWQPQSEKAKQFTCSHWSVTVVGIWPLRAAVSVSAICFSPSLHGVLCSDWIKQAGISLLHEKSQIKHITVNVIMLFTSTDNV